MNSADRSLPVLACACANLRRTARAVTGLYNRELQPTGLELTQFTLLTALEATGETSQGNLGKVLALDTTSLTRMLRLPAKRGWIAVRRGDDRRQRLLRLTRSGRATLEEARPYWEVAQKKLRRALGESRWGTLPTLLTEVAVASGAG